VLENPDSALESFKNASFYKIQVFELAKIESHNLVIEKKSEP